jgi:prepilin-type N-terminal cleavage/methylation domain-containing protein
MVCHSIAKSNDDLPDAGLKRFFPNVGIPSEEMMKNKPGFTLIELLMVMAVISILSTLALLTLAGVRDDARKARTDTLLKQISTVLQERFESIGSRPLPFNFRRDFLAAPPGGFVSSQVPNWIQQQYIFKRTICEWVRSEMPVYHESLAVYPSLESQQEYIPLPRPGFNPGDEVTFENYWPRTAGTEWVQIYTEIMSKRPSPSFLFMRSNAPTLDPLADGGPLDNEFWFKENNNGWDGVAVPGVANSLNARQLAASVVESSEWLYIILSNTYDQEGNRGTHFLRPDDVADINNNGFLEIVDGNGVPLVFSITIQNISQDGLPIDRNGDGFGGAASTWPYPDFRDAMLDPRYPGEPSDYQIHLGSISYENLPPHLQHLKYADFSVDYTL